MTIIRFLHLSDLHFRADTEADTQIVVQALARDIEELARDRACDALLFSGDLVFSGCTDLDFDDAYDKTILRIASAAQVEEDRIFIAPGNHDICREKVRAFSALQEGLLAQLSSTEAVNSFLDQLVQGAPEANLALGRLGTFKAFLSRRLAHLDVTHPLVALGDLIVDGRSIHIAMLNSAWRATGESDDVDLGHLLIGERQADYALGKVSGADFAVALVHHPLEWLASFDRASVEPLILGGFHMVCSGHLHESSPKSIASASGTCVISQAGSMYAGRRWYNGYQIIDVDLLSGEIEFTLREYDDRNREFASAEGLIRGGKLRLENARAFTQDDRGQVELFLRQYRHALRERAKEHLDFVRFSEEYTDRVLDEFVSPPLYEREVPDPAVDGARATEHKELSVSELLNTGENFILIGDRKTGRTSLAFHMALEIAAGRTAKPSIPVFVDIRTYRFNFYDLRKSVLSFHGPAPKGFELEKSFESGLYTFFVDNLDVYDEVLLKRFADHVSTFPNCRWVVIASPSSEGVIRDRLLSTALPGFRRLHVGQLPRRSIRKMTQCWAQDNELNDKDTFEAVVNQLNSDGLPKTPYMVALVLWALQQRKGGERLNEALLLRNVVEHLLGRADFTLSTRGAFNPTSKELTLQEIAWTLRDQSGFIEENQLLIELGIFFKKKRLPFSASDVLNKLVQCGILNREDGIVAFKYKAFQEYFIALRMKSESAALTLALTDLDFLKFRREIELLSGLRQKNDDVIAVIMAVLESRVPERFVKCDPAKIDTFTRKGVGPGTTKTKLNEIRRTRLTDEQVDKIMDEADRRAVARGERPVSESLKESEGDIYKAALAREAEAIDADSASTSEPLRPATHMASIDLLARVVRNSDFSDFDIKGPAAALVLKSWTKILILMLDEIHDIVSSIRLEDGSKVEQGDLDIMNYLLARVLMAIAGQAVIGQMSSPTIADTVAGILDEQDPCTGEKLLGAFLLEDANYPGWQKRWTEQIKNRKAAGFVVDAFTDRLWAIVSRRALDADQSKRVNEVVDAVEERLELNKTQKSQVLESIRTATNLKRLEDSDFIGKP